MKMANCQTVYIAQASQPSQPVNLNKGEGSLFDPGWVPLWQTILWIGFWMFIILYVRKNFNQQLSTLFNVFVSRVKDGSSIKVGSWVEIGTPSAIASQQVT
jgi:hypothetical protein